MSGKTSYESRHKYESRVYDKVLLRLRNDELSTGDIKAAAALDGESVNGYITECILRRMERDGFAPTGRPDPDKAANTAAGPAED